MERHPDNEPLSGVIVFRPEASLIYVNADAVLQAVQNRIGEPASASVRLVVCDLSAAPYLDLAGSRMLRELQADLCSRGMTLRIIGAHGAVRDLLRADNLEDKVGGLDRAATIEKTLRATCLCAGGQ